MSLKKHKPTVDDLIQERKDVRKMFKESMKEVNNIVDRIQKLDKEIEKLEKTKKKK
jgi:flagellar hook-associated protein FlgK